MTLKGIFKISAVVGLVFLAGQANAGTFCKFQAANIRSAGSGATDVGPTLTPVTDGQDAQYTVASYSGTTKNCGYVECSWPSDNPATVSGTLVHLGTNSGLNSVWDVAISCPAANSTMKNQTYGTAVPSSGTADSATTNGRTDIAIGAVTPGGTPAANVACRVRVCRLPADGGDTNTGALSLYSGAFTY